MSLIAALIFVLISSPSTYALSSRIVTGFTKTGIPTAIGLMAHGAFFFLIIYAFMMPWKASEACVCRGDAVCAQGLDKEKMMDMMKYQEAMKSQKNGKMMNMGKYPGRMKY